VAAQAETLVKREIEKAASSTHFYGGQLGWTRWVVKNDDLDLIGRLGPAAIAIVTFLSVPAAPVAVMAVGLAISMVGIAQKFRAKKIVVEPEDYYILMAMRQAGPSTIEDLSKILSGTHIYGQEVWDETRTAAALNKLKQVHQGDGSATALVNEGTDGRWSASGI